MRAALRRKVQHKLGDEARFIRTWLESPLRTGAVSPSGQALAKAMAQVVDPRLPGPVIELGPGTGPVTEALIRRGVAESRLILVEFDTDFCIRLRRRYPRATVIEGDAYALQATLAGCLDTPAAACVSGLPLLMKSEAKRLALLDQAFDLMGPARPFIQFTYGLASPIPRKSCWEPDTFRAEALAPIWLNIPPARVWVYHRLARA